MLLLVVQFRMPRWMHLRRLILPRTMPPANSSCCNLQSPDDVPVISPPDLAAVLAAQNVTDVLLSEVTAPLVTISIEERALAPAAPLLRVPYLERLLEARHAA